MVYVVLDKVVVLEILLLDIHILVVHHLIVTQPVGIIILIINKFIINLKYLSSVGQLKCVTIHISIIRQPCMHRTPHHLKSPTSDAQKMTTTPNIAILLFPSDLL